MAKYIFIFYGVILAALAVSWLLFDPAGNQFASSDNGIPGDKLFAVNMKPEAGPTTGTGPQGPQLSPEPVIVAAGDCLPQKPIGGLDKAVNSQLRRIDAYQKLCGSRAFEQVMFFTSMPKTSEEAETMATDMVAALGESYKFGVSPIVIVEPVRGNSDYLAFADIARGVYDAELYTYFAKLKAKGIDDAKMGLWVPFPEPNINEWGLNNNNPDDFAAAVNHYATICKKFFPGGKLSVLLDNLSYDVKTGNYAHLPLDPYLRGLDNRNLENIGLQGFPGAETGADNQAGTFLDHDLAVASANFLDLKSVWLNTGTFSTARGENGRIINMSAPERSKILDGITQEAIAAKSAGLKVSINLFAQDKSVADEGIDWSYLKTDQDRKILVDFISRANRFGIGLSLYDDPED